VKRKAVVLVSGGLDSATALAVAVNQGYECHALTFNYGQRHKTELLAAKRVVESFGVKDHKLLDIDLTQIGGSALTDHSIDVPRRPKPGIPVTYVPARNTIFLSLALGYAEVTRAYNIFIGVNAIDYSGYPDCRPEYISAFENLSNLATRAGVEGAGFRILTPLIKMTKADIIKTGAELGVDFALTVSCYQADNEGRACSVCDSCRIRKDGFNAANIPDPTLYYQ